MPGTQPTSLSDQIFAHNQFEVRDLNDEIRVDQLCVQLLRIFCRDRIERHGIEPLAAGQLARGADYFLREFVVADRCENIFLLPPGRVRQFAGNWYIVKTLEPNLAELGDILMGVEAFYRFCFESGKVTAECLESIVRECGELEYYQRRIDTFWAITGDGFAAWDAECSLKTR